jgi:NCS1 family nucleobase:cation symporter-1
VGLTVFSILTGLIPWMYNYGWFTGSFLGGIIYLIIAKRPEPALASSAA